MLPLISIIIPHFNRASLLLQTIESIKQQDYQNWEVIIVDDSSSKEQWNLVQRYASEKIYIIERSDGLKGPSRCRNLGVAKSKGDYIIFLDSDDLLAPWCLSQRVDAIQKHPQNDLWVFQVLLFEQKPGDMNTCWNNLEGNNDLERFIRSNPPWHTSSPIWKRNVFINNGGFNEMLIYGDDSELHIRLLLKKPRVIKFKDQLPNVFIRRSDIKRLTNRLNEKTLKYRRYRLIEGSILLKNNKALSNLWEGQYFFEAEFILFNQENSWKWIKPIIKEWKNNHTPPFFKIALVQLYFSIACLSKEKFYFIIRILRRLLIILLPDSFFPSGTDFQSFKINNSQANEIKKLL